MMYEQRVPLPAESARPGNEPWQPELPDGQHADRSDAYVMVDELADGRLTLAVASWPVLDGAGRLVFQDGESTLSFAADEFQAAIDVARAGYGQATPTRPLRIGDTFLVRNLLPYVNGEAPSVPPADWDLLDVTASARAAAKVALYAATTPTTSRGDPALQAASPDTPNELRRSPAQVARPAV